MAAMAQESDALFHVLVAIQAFLEDGLTVSSMDFIDQALQKFRLELAQPRNARTRATMTAGLLVCTIQVRKKKGPVLLTPTPGSHFPGCVSPA